VSPKGAFGVMQLMPGTARDMGVDPHIPAQNIEGGAKYLRQMYDRFGDWGTAVQAYNAGPRAVQSGRAQGYPETQAYTRKVMGGSMPQSGADIFGLGPAQGSAQQAQTGADIFADAPKPATPSRAADPVMRGQRVSAQDIAAVAGPPRVGPMKAIAGLLADRLGGSDIEKAASALLSRGVSGVMDAGAGLLGNPQAHGPVGAGVGGQYNRGLLEGGQGVVSMAGKAVPFGAPLAAASQEIINRAVPATAPTNALERGARVAGQMTVNAAMPGSALQRVKNVALPALGGTAASEAAKLMGAGDKGQAVAQFAGSVAGGVGAAVNLPKNMEEASHMLDTLKAQKDAAYQAVDHAGVEYKPEAVNTLVQGIRDDMANSMMDPDLHPKAVAVVKRFDALKDQPLTLGKLDQLRRLARDNVVASTSKDERRIGYQILKNIDEFIGAAGPEQVNSAGDPQAAAQSLMQARDLNTRVAKMESVMDAAEKAKNRTGSTGTGGNIDNATRQEVRKVMERGKKWSPQEQAQLEGVVYGTPGQNVLRNVGRMSPSGNGLMTGLNLVTAGATHGASLGVTGMAIIAKHIADAMTQQKVAGLLRTIAGGGEAATGARSEFAGLAAKRPDVAKVYGMLAGSLLGPVAIASTPAQAAPPRRP
jgi:hypothetical protein